MCFMARDRLVFETIKLSNGMTVHYYPEDIPLARMSIMIPFGHAHNCGSIVPGTAHFLEHIVFGRSKQFPRKGEYEEVSSLEGATTNAVTRTFNTSFYFEAFSVVNYTIVLHEAFSYNYLRLAAGLH